MYSLLFDLETWRPGDAMIIFYTVVYWAADLITPASYPARSVPAAPAKLIIVILSFTMVTNPECQPPQNKLFDQQYKYNNRTSATFCNKE